MENTKTIAEIETEEKFDPNRIVKCCLCGREIKWWQSNNPWPIVDDEDSRCCSDCNAYQVLPARWKAMSRKPVGKRKTANV